MQTHLCRISPFLTRRLITLMARQRCKSSQGMPKPWLCVKSILSHRLVRLAYTIVFDSTYCLLSWGFFSGAHTQTTIWRDGTCGHAWTLLRSAVSLQITPNTGGEIKHLSIRSVRWHFMRVWSARLAAFQTPIDCSTSCCCKADKSLRLVTPDLRSKHQHCVSSCRPHAKGHDIHKLHESMLISYLPCSPTPKVRHEDWRWVTSTLHAMLHRHNPQSTSGNENDILSQPELWV